MNCPYTPIDAGFVSLSRVLASHVQCMHLARGNDIVVALHPCPGEGPGES